MNFSLVVAWFVLACGPLLAADRPNIIFIMTDDHAAHAISAYGSRINRTPHLDRLSQQGMRFDRCFAVNSICTPSRATILTGQYSHKNGVPVFNPLDGSQPHVAKQLHAVGYFTAMIGKWHLGTDPTGFDHWEILPGQGRYFDPVLYDRDGAKEYKGYATDVITDLGVALLEKRPADRPFFLMLHHKAPHREWLPNAKYREEFAKKQIPEPPTLYDDYATRTDALREQRQSVFRDLTRRDLKLSPPPAVQGRERQQWLAVKPTEVDIEIDGKTQTLRGDALNKWKYQRYMQDYLACVQSVDDNVGRLLDWLDGHGLRDNTVVIYTSDQGFFLGDHGLYDKRFMYDESIRMPFLVRWPRVIKPGSVNDSLVINCDFAPTFLDLAGMAAPREMQGRSLVPLFRGRRPFGWRKSFYYRYYHDPGHHDTRAHYGVRTATHKLIYFWKKRQWECFDLRRDPYELHNIYSDPKSQKLVAGLKTDLMRLKRQVQDNDEFANELPKDGVDGPPRKWKPGYAPGN
ncbi:MAG: sulfatase [Verrucomicrobiales bacterium]|nr:sulfatase [Verrucomicrobiales bacterium]